MIQPIDFTKVLSDSALRSIATALVECSVMARSAARKGADAVVSVPNGDVVISYDEGGEDLMTIRVRKAVGR